MTIEIDFERRFGGMRRLYGEAGLAKLQAAHIAVVGIGGVGSWAVEAIVRNAIGAITLIDLDNIAESNFNRQIHALEANIGKAKVTAMRERILQINPSCKVYEIEDFITPKNINDALGGNNHEASGAHFDVIIDATDDVKAKIALAVYCKEKRIPLVMAGAAGGRLDATKIQTADLSQVTGDKLLAKVRNQLRRDYQFPKASNSKKSAKFGITCIFSDEQARKPIGLQPNNHATSGDAENCALTGLNCAGYGSSVCVTAPFGFAAAAQALNMLL